MRRSLERIKMPNDFRAFRLDRMRDLSETGASFRPRRVPLLRDYLVRMRAELESYHNA